MRLLLDSQAFIHIARQPEALPVAQAIHESLTLVTGDHQVRLYPVPCLWD